MLHCPPLLIRLFLEVLAALFRWRRLPHGWSAEFIASRKFLDTWQWKQVRYEALRNNDGRCELCGRSKHDGIVLNVDHVKSRRARSDLALNVRNLQVLCGDGAGGGCNEGKGNRFSDDWRHPMPPHRP